MIDTLVKITTKAATTEKVFNNFSDLQEWIEAETEKIFAARYATIQNESVREFYIENNADKIFIRNELQELQRNRLSETALETSDFSISIFQAEKC